MRKEVHDFQRDLTYDATTGVVSILGAAIPSATTIVSSGWSAPTNLTQTRTLDADLATGLGTAWTTPTNMVAKRSAYDANSTTIDELADVLGTVITDYKSLIAHVNTIADVLGTVIRDLRTATVPTLKT
jgi:hypothetical protein